MTAKVAAAVHERVKKLEAAVDAGYMRAVLPSTNRSDVLLNPSYRNKVELVYTSHLVDVLQNVLASDESGPLITRLTQTYSKVRRTSNGHAIVKAKK